MFINNSNNNLEQRKNMLAARIPGITFLTVYFIAVVLYQFFFERWSIILLCIYFLQMAVISLFIWFADKLINFNNWFYFILQGIFTFITTFIINTNNDSYNIITFTLYGYFIGLAIGLVSKKKFYIITFLLLLFLLNIFLLIPKETFQHFFIIVPIMFLIISYALMFFSQVRERINTQLTLEKLKLAHAQVEQLTLQNERQRMARDLHDTLAQGLVGFNLQLEAAISYLSRSNITKAKEIITNVRSNSKQLLAESRQVIDDLRDSSQKQLTFNKKIEQSIDYFSSTTNINFNLKCDIEFFSDTVMEQHCYYIIRESLINIIKHSNAKHVIVKLLMDKKYYHFSIIDDGKGFDFVSNLNKKGSYGLIGIRERVELLNGNISFKSENKKGTEIIVNIPRSRRIMDV